MATQFRDSDSATPSDSEELPNQEQQPLGGLFGSMFQTMFGGGNLQELQRQGKQLLQKKLPKQSRRRSAPSEVREIAYSQLRFGDSLGTGGQGAVFEGKWKARGLAVAIKRVLGKIRHEEAALLNKLSHPNVITFYGICTEKYPEYFIITELAEGGSLFSLIHEKHYHPNLEESLRWAKEIAEGMAYLHQQKVIHRDLKSQNVLLTADGVTKLCDFGSAKEFDHTTVQTGTGTYRWIAPEVLKGEKVSLSCDVYSYGMVLFEIFKQEIPFAGVHDLKVISMISEGETPAIPASVKPYLASLMKYCWQINPKARPSFEEVLAILKKKECPEPVGESPEDTQDTTDGGPADPSQEESEDPSQEESEECPEPVGESPEATQDTTNGGPADPSQEESEDSSQEESEATSLNLLDLPKLQKALESVAIIWYPLGMQLKVNAKTLKDISKKAGDSSTAMGMMLNCWLNDTSSAPTLEGLCKSLSHPLIGEDTIAQKLLKEKDNF